MAGTWNEHPAPDMTLAYQRLEQRAVSDAYGVAETIWREGLPAALAESGDLQPLAVSATHQFIARLKQESQGVPRWAWASPEAMASYIQQTGDRYYAAFLWSLAEIISSRIKASFTLPRPTQPPVQSSGASERRPHQRQRREA